MPSATANEIGIANHRLSPAPPRVPVSLTNRIVRIPIAPVLEPADRSNSPPIISIDTATAMMPRVAATSRIEEAPPAVPNLVATAQKKIQIAMAPIEAPISGRMSRRWNTPRYASRSSPTAWVDAGGVVTSIVVVTIFPLLVPHHVPSRDIPHDNHCRSFEHERTRRTSDEGPVVRSLVCSFSGVPLVLSVCRLPPIP